VFGRVFRVEDQDRFEWLRRFFVQGNCLAHPSAMIRRDLLARIGYFDPSFFQLPDLDLWVRVATVAELKVLPEVLTRYRAHSNGGNVSGPSEANENRRLGELTEILCRYGQRPILDDLARIFDLGLDERDMPETHRTVWALARLGLLATGLPSWPRRAAGIRFLREALRQNEELDVLDQAERSRVVLHLHRAAGELQVQ
jgi:hypothetical protein